MTKEYYQILEIDENATAEEIKKAYRKLALKWHPDKWSTKSLEERAKANEEMQKVNKAYEVLGDEEKKRRYDLGETSFSTARDSESFEEYVRRMNEQDEAEIEEINEKLEKLKRIAKILFRSEIEGIIRGKALLNEVWEKHFNDMDSNLWTPYSNWVEKVRNIEIGDDENDKEGIDKKELNEFKEKMINAIKERGVQLKAEKMAKANSDLERAKLKAIETIEKELEDRGLKIEDLEEEYHNYEEVINGLSKKFKIRSYEDKVIEAIRQKSQSGRFEAKWDDFDRQGQPEQSNEEAGKSKNTDSSLNNDKKFEKELRTMEKMKEEEKFQSRKFKTDPTVHEESRQKLQFLVNKIKEKGENSKKKLPQQDKVEDGALAIDLANVKKITLISEENLLVKFDENSKLNSLIITDEKITKSQEFQKIKNYLQKENRKSVSRQEINDIISDASINSTLTIEDSKNNVALLIAGEIGILVVGLIIGLLINRKKVKQPSRK